MSDDYDGQYYLNREASARTMAAKCRDPVIATIHTDMARRYAELADEAAERSSKGAIAR